jgi:flagellin
MNINDRLGKHQYRLATGKRINSAADDTAGYSIAKGLEARGKGLSVAMSNVSNAKNIMDVAEGGFQNVMDILHTLKEKATQASDDSLSADQRTAIGNQITALIEEVDDIVAETKFNGSALIDGTYSKTFQTGEGVTDSLAVALNNSDSAALSINALDLSTHALATVAMGAIDSAITTLSTAIQEVGDIKSRLSSKETALSVAYTNTEAVRSTVEDADFAKEQMQVMKLQILQQTAVSSFAQSNAAPQVVLSLF